MLWHPCCWHRCPYKATGQVTVPGPPALGGLALAWLCSLHQRMWPMAVAMTSPPAHHRDSALWISFALGRAPIIGWGFPGRIR
jgi:hypothetical protein